ncbi:hypothetical protein [Marinilabilia rubra]|uniref:Uncharacterized protein n=1 Tax=Marinilabilia rubra TaxID=2162893 RepID=A0A2U2B8H5_9BACT|nr:hypothetical protein [Marinilabilia rubra]PWD99365.1 hypothetical protein DDZ16_10155 [Marinilabilia rubra]
MKNLKSFFQTMLFFIVLIFLVEYFFTFGLQVPGWNAAVQTLRSILPSVLVVFFVFFFREVYRK